MKNVRRTKLIAARIEAGFNSQEDFVNSLREDGVQIKVETYKNIESGRNKTVDVVIAFIIVKKINKSVEEIFLSIPVYKIHLNKSNPKPAA